MTTEHHNRDAMIMHWWKTQRELNNIKNAEAHARKEVVDVCFAGAKVGTNNLPLGSGYVLKAVVRQNYGLKKDEDGTYTRLTQILAQLPSATALALVKWKPEISSTAYKMLTAEEQALVNEVLVITDGTPSLEMAEPKEKK